MFSLLLVDDHIHLVESMVHTVPWGSIGIAHVYQAYSGSEALELMDRIPIDILITDIRMPGMTGLELIQQARVRKPKLQCVLLTGYVQFEYAKRAIKLRAIDYLIKPVKDEELLAVVRSITEQLGQRQEEEGKAVQKLRLNLPSMRNNLLHDILSEVPVTRRTLEEKLKMYELPFSTGDRCRLLLLDPDPAFELYSPSDRSLIEYSIVNIAEETLSPYYQHWSVRTSQGYIAFVIKPITAWAVHKDGDDNHEAVLLNLQSNVRRYLQGELSVYVSEDFIFPEPITKIYHTGMALLHKWSGEPSGVFLLEGGKINGSRKVVGLRSIHQPPTLLQLADDKNLDGLRNKTKTIFAELEVVGPHSRINLTEAYTHLLSCFVSVAHGSGFVLDEMVVGTGMGHSVKPFRTLVQLRDWAIVVLDLLTGSIRPDTTSKTHAKIVSHVQQFVREQLGENITLQAIAETVYLHPAYLSKIYKETTGSNLSDYILQVRMERAKELLEHSTSKIYEIAARVGYQSTQHFIREFKKFYGDTPKSYRFQNK